jgi:hypothetical protein
MYAVLCCCCRRLPCSTTFHAINNQRCLFLLTLTGTRTVVQAIQIATGTIATITTTTIVSTPPCPPAQSRLPPTATAGNLLACDVMQCLCLLLINCLPLLLFRVMCMCQWYFNPPAGFAAAVAGLWFGWLLLCICGTESK